MKVREMIHTVLPGIGPLVLAQLKIDYLLKRLEQSSVNMGFCELRTLLLTFKEKSTEDAPITVAHVWETYGDTDLGNPCQ